MCGRPRLRASLSPTLLGESSTRGSESCSTATCGDTSQRGCHRRKGMRPVMSSAWPNGVPRRRLHNSTHPGTRRNLPSSGRRPDSKSTLSDIPPPLRRFEREQMGHAPPCDDVLAFTRALHPCLKKEKWGGGHEGGLTRISVLVAVQNVSRARDCTKLRAQGDACTILARESGWMAARATSCHMSRAGARHSQFWDRTTPSTHLGPVRPRRSRARVRRSSWSIVTGPPLRLPQGRTSSFDTTSRISRRSKPVRAGGPAGSGKHGEDRSSLRVIVTPAADTLSSAAT